MDDIMKELRKQTKEDAKEFIRIEACSARECTGLIASKAIDEEQAEAYDEIYSYNPENYYNVEKNKESSSYNPGWFSFTTSM